MSESLSCRTLLHRLIMHNAERQCFLSLKFQFNEAQRSYAKILRHCFLQTRDNINLHQGRHYLGALGVCSPAVLSRSPLEPKLPCTVSTFITSMTFFSSFSQYDRSCPLCILWLPSLSILWRPSPQQFFSGATTDSNINVTVFSPSDSALSIFYTWHVIICFYHSIHVLHNRFTVPCLWGSFSFYPSSHFLWVICFHAITHQLPSYVVITLT